MLNVQNLTVRYGDICVLDHVSFSVEEGQWLMIVGPNGAGKSTALSAISQTIPYEGTVLYQGNDVHRMKPMERAQKMGILSQNHFVGYSFTVEEVVKMGRYSRKQSFFSTEDKSSEEAVEEALQLTGLWEQRKQSVLTLSGGELQRTFLAQVLAQDPQLLLLDEPTNHLDLIYQKQIFSLIAEWLKKPGRAVAAVVHDLSLAKAYGTHALLMHHGKTVALGSKEEILTPQNLNEIYQMDVPAWMNQLLGQWKE